MTDLSSMSNDELMAIAKSSAQPSDLSGMSNEDLMAIARPEAAPTWKDRVQAHQAGVFNATAHLVGAVPDAAYQLFQLAKANNGVVYHALTGKGIPEFLQPGSSTTPVGDWLAKQADKLHDVIPTTPDRPDDTPSRYSFNTSAILPGLAVGGGSARNFFRGIVPAAAGSGTASYVKEKRPFESEAANNALAIGSDLLTQSLVRGAGNVAASVLNPWTEGGRSKLVGRALEDAAADPNKAIVNLANSKEYVPGSQPTTGVASQDVGLLSLEKGVRSQAENAPEWASRSQANNAARQQYLGGVAKDEGALIRAIADRNKQADTNYGKAWSEAKTPDESVGLGPPVGTQKPVADISDLMSRPSIRKALGEATERLSDEGVNPESGDIIVRKLHYAKLALDDRIEAAQRAGEGNQARTLISAKNALVDKIEEIAPSYKEARESFKSASGPINQMEILQALRSKAANSVPDVTGVDILNQGKWRTAINRALENGDLGKLTPEQRTVVDNITADLNRESSANASTIRQPGSDTNFNISSNQLLGNLLGQKLGGSALGKTVGRAIDWAYHSPDEMMRAKLAEALLHQNKGLSLLKLAKDTKPMDLRAVLGQYAIPATAIPADAKPQQ